MSLDLRWFGALLLSFAFLCSNQCKKTNTYTKYGNAYSLTSYAKDNELSTVNNVDVIRQGKMDNDDNKALNTKAVSDNNLPYQRPLPPLPVVGKPNQNNSSVSGIYNSFNKRVVIPDPDYAWLEGTRHDNSGPYFLRIPTVPPRPTRRSSNRKMNLSSMIRKIKIWFPSKGLIQRSRR